MILLKGKDDIFRNESKAHTMSECPYTMIDCIHKKQGCNARMQRKKLKNHLDKFCSFRSLHCPYTKYGCLFTKKNGKLGAKEMQQHLKNGQYRILHLELQVIALQKQMGANENKKQHIAYNINNNNININNNINNNNNNRSNNALYSRSSNKNLLFAFLGSDEGKYCQKNGVLCIDIQKGTSQTILDPLSIALINQNKLSQSHQQSLTKSYSDKTMNADLNNRCWDIRNYGACVGNDALINNEKCTVLFRVGGWNSNDEQEIALPHVDGYVIERNEWLHNLPNLPSCSSGCGCVYSNDFGLMVVGGESPAVTDTLYQLPFGIKSSKKRRSILSDYKCDDDLLNDGDNERKNDLKWHKLKSMKRARTNLALSSFVDGNMNCKEYIFVCGGYNNGESLKYCELYDFEANEWTDLPKSMYRHQSAGCCYWQNANGMNQNSMIVIGGYPEAKLVEEYSFYKNKWYKLPSTQHNHQFLPSIWVHSDAKINPNGCGILLCAGNRCNLKSLNDRIATGYVEFFDKREAIQKWHTLYSLRDLVYFGLHSKIDSKEDDGRRVRRIFR